MRTSIQLPGGECSTGGRKVRTRSRSVNEYRSPTDCGMGGVGHLAGVDTIQKNGGVVGVDTPHEYGLSASEGPGSNNL